jgi:serine/threonine-protein kinase SRPK3
MWSANDQPIADLYGGNVLFAAPTISALGEERLRSYLGEPEIGAVQRIDGDTSSEPSVPRYLARPKTFRGCNTEIRIVDLGAGKENILVMRYIRHKSNIKAFFHDTPPRTLHTPMHIRAPEALFDQPLSPFVDMWSMGCLVCNMHLF